MGNKVSIPVVILTAEVLPVKFKIKAEYPKTSAKTHYSELLMKPVSITHEKCNDISLVIDPDAKYTFTVKIKVGKYIKQLHWLLVVVEDTGEDQPPPVDGKLPRHAFTDDMKQFLTTFPMSTMKKGILRYTFDSLMTLDKYPPGSNQTLWFYTFDQNDIVHHMHSSIRTIGEPGDVGKKLLPVSNMSRMSSTVSNVSNDSESLDSGALFDEVPAAQTMPESREAPSDESGIPPFYSSQALSRTQSNGLLKTISQKLKTKDSEWNLSPEDQNKRTTLATVEVYLLVIITLQFIVIVTLARLVYTQSLRISYLTPDH
eukprot:CFRG3978T1